MSPQEFIHPDDAAALKTLESIPVLPSIAKKIMDISTERQVHGLNLATKVRLSSTQLPELYNILPPICIRLGIPEPEFYLEMDPSPNAYAFGETYTAISITSGIVEMLSKEELTAIVAHECGHIICHHMLYHSMVWELLKNMNDSKSFRELVAPVFYALMFWSRKSELSSDRVSAFIAGPATAVRALSRLAGGPISITENLNLVELAEQADEYDIISDDGLWNKTLKMSTLLTQSHPFTSIRIREVLRWSSSDQFKALMSKYPACPKCYRAIVPDALYCNYCGTKL